MEDHDSFDEDAAAPPAGTAAAASTTTASPTTATPTAAALLTCAFNQDGGCLAVGTTTGFAVHNLYPHYACTVNRTLSGGGIGLVEMLFRCNLMALVGGGPSPQAAPHRVLIWDDHIPKEIGELSFRQVVLRVRLRKDAIAVALRDRVYVYHLADLSLRDKIYTSDNEHGLLCLSTQIQDMVLCCPSVTVGHVRVELYALRKTVLIEAHESALRGLCLTNNGQKVATASIRGTVIRVWNAATATCSHEFRRGVERANITCLAFSWNYQYLACTSDKGTAHVFSLMDNCSSSNSNGNNNNTRQNGRSADVKRQHQDSSSSSLSVTSTLTQMFFSTVRRSVEGDAKKSICQIRGVPHPLACAFCSEAAVGGAATGGGGGGASKNLLAVAGWDADGNGVLLLSEFDGGCGEQQQEARRVGYHVLCQTSSIPENETEEAKRRRRLRGWTPEIPQTPEGGRLYVGERLEILEQGMEQIQFDDEGGDGDEFEFISVTALRPEEVQAAKEQQQQAAAAAAVAAEQQQINHHEVKGERKNVIHNSGNPSSQQQTPQQPQDYHPTQGGGGEGGGGQHAASSLSSQLTEDVRSNGTVGDSVRTEPLGDSETPESETAQSP